MMSSETTKTTHVLGLFILLSLIWLAWSGHFEPMLLGFGVVSVVLTVWVSWRLEVIGEEGQPLKWGLRPLSYIPWLVKAIVVANIDVIQRILKGNKAVQPTWAIVPAKQRTELGRVVFANSITLTPGTVSVDLDKNEDGLHYILVNAISPEGAADLDGGGEMGERVTVLEGK
jgi:multicomponent Na+:H+ antiporter subunit E